MKNVPKKNSASPRAVVDFDRLPDGVLIDFKAAGLVLGGRSRMSIYRDIRAGRLSMVKVGNSSRLRVGEVRKLANGATA